MHLILTLESEKANCGAAVGVKAVWFRAREGNGQEETHPYECPTKTFLFL